MEYKPGQIYSTKNYDIFKFRSDNRKKISQIHVDRIAASINEHNFLREKPIDVTDKMEILDGQHRLQAAKKLGIEIFFKISADWNIRDVVLMNTNLPWDMGDYLNFFVENGYPDYIRLRNIMKKHDLSWRTVFMITCGHTREARETFKQGKFKFNYDDLKEEYVGVVKDTIAHITKTCNYPYYSKTNKFWSALLTITLMPNFSRERWMIALARDVEKFCAKATREDYVKFFLQVYNWALKKNDRIG